MLCVNPLEIFSSKVIALLNRSAARDLYDIFNLQNAELIEGKSQGLFKKCIMFYAAIGSEEAPERFDFSMIGNISEKKIRRDLMPVLRKSERFNLQNSQRQVENYLERVLLPEENLAFWNSFKEGEYKPETMFNDTEILLRIKDHPMALWKCRKDKGVSNGLH